MATRKFYIELVVQGINHPDQMNALTEALRTAGRQLNAAAILICGDVAAPSIELSAEDLVDGRTEININDE